MQFFKIYVNGKSPYAGSPIPEINKWTEKKEPDMCVQGWHVTTRPDLYRNNNWDEVKVYLCEGKGSMTVGNDKVSFQQIKIIQEITPEWEYLPMFPFVKVLLVAIWRREHKNDDMPFWADLSGANLSKASLTGADLSKADLYGANLSKADLSGADLYGANLTGADLSGAYLSGANLSKADLSGADLYGAHGVKNNSVFSKEHQEQAHC